MSTFTTGEVAALCGIPTKLLSMAVYTGAVTPALRGGLGKPHGWTARDVEAVWALHQLELLASGIQPKGVQRLRRYVWDAIHARAPWQTVVVVVPIQEPIVRLLEPLAVPGYVASLDAVSRIVSLERVTPMIAAGAPG